MFLARYSQLPCRRSDCLPSGCRNGGGPARAARRKGDSWAYDHCIYPQQASLGGGDAVRGCLDRVSLDAACLDRYPHELSGGGQRQRVGIARAVLMQPDFVLADEIVSGLDVSTQAQALKLLKSLSLELGLAMAFISHDLSVIRAICDHVYVLRSGRSVEEGPCEQVFTNPSSGYTRALLDAIPLPEYDPGWLERRS